MKSRFIFRPSPSLVAVTSIAMLLGLVTPAAAVTETISGSTKSLTYTYTGNLETFTVPENVSQITITVKGAEGGRGGNDSSGRPPEGGYVGTVTGTISVTPGDVITVAVGQGGGDSPLAPGGVAGVNTISGDANVAQGGLNPLDGFDGGDGGSPGPDGSSGYGGSGGAATVVQIGTISDSDAIATIVAGGSGGSGGSGQYQSLIGKLPYDFHESTSIADSTNGEIGLYTKQRCIDTNMTRCDGGGGAGGGGGAIGGARGGLEFGAGNDTEWFGLGAFPGQNSTGGFAELLTSYIFTPTNNGHGTVVISYSTGVPGAPTNVTGQPNDQRVDLYWVAPTNPGNSAITGYEVQYAEASSSSWSTAQSCSGTTTNCSISGLTNGTAYKFRVAAINAEGTGGYAQSTVNYTPAGAPSAPTIDNITSGDGSLSVAFTPGASSLDITDYQYLLNGTGNWTSLASVTAPLRISGLVNGQVYQVQIRAVNSAGVSTASNSVNGTPGAVPGAPTITSVSPGVDGTSLVVSFVPGYTGGSQITDYEYALSVGENTNSFSDYVALATTASPYTITGLSQGTAYTVKLRAKNQAGVGPGSPYIVGVTLASPNQPTGVTVTASDTKLTVGYDAYTAETNGGSAVSKIEYSLNSGATWIDAGTLANPFTISGLENGTSYPVQIRATNPIGVSQPSAAVSATPIARPSSPNQVLVNVSPGSAQLSWLAPSSNGGATITGYVASAFTVASGGESVATCQTQTLSCTIVGLTNGTTYYFAVAATNAAGTGVASSPRVVGTPAAAPAAPTITSLTAGSSHLTVNFSQSGVDANAPVTGYQYSLNGGSNWVNASGLTSPFVISNLTAGTSYTVIIRANSSVGNSPNSASVTGMPVAAPDAVAPSSITYQASNGSVQVSWTAPNNNGAAISSYEVTAFTEVLAGTRATSCTTTTATTCTLNGLSNGTTYYVTIQSQNSVGYSLRSAPRVAVRPGNAAETSIALSAANVTAGQSVTITATVPETASGTVNFLAGNNSITGCSAQQISNAQATCVTSALLPGTYNISANYSGDSYYSSAQSSASQLVVGAIAQAISFAALQNRMFSTSTVVLAATGGASGNPVIFTSSTPSICSTGGAAGATLTMVQSGTCTIRANQAGSTNYSAATEVIRSFEIQTQVVTSFALNWTTSDSISDVASLSGVNQTLPSPVRQSYVFQGWYTAATGGSLVGAAGASYTPRATATLHARWVQKSLAYLGLSTRIASITTVAGVGNSYSAAGGGSSVLATYPADALPAGTVIDVYVKADSSRALELIEDVSSFVVSMVVAWKAPDDTVPDTAAGKPLELLITNPDIKAGAKIYSVLGDQVLLLGTATQDGQVSVQITQDPEIFVANPDQIITPTSQPSSGSSGGGSVSTTTADSSVELFVDSLLVASEYRLNPSGLLTVSYQNLNLNIQGLSQTQLAPKALKKLSLRAGDAMPISFSGLAASSAVYSRVGDISDSAVILASATGSVTGQILWPSTLPRGDKRLSFEMTSAEGKKLLLRVNVAVPQTKLSELDRIKFSKGGHALTKSTKRYLDKMIQEAAGAQLTSVNIHGTASGNSSTVQMRKLAILRARAIADYLKSRGVKAQLNLSAGTPSGQSADLNRVTLRMNKLVSD